MMAMARNRMAEKRHNKNLSRKRKRSNPRRTRMTPAERNADYIYRSRFTGPIVGSNIFDVGWLAIRERELGL